MLNTRTPLVRVAVVEVAATGGVLLGGVATRAQVSAGWHTVTAGDLAAAPFDRVLVQSCAAILLLCGAWLWLVTTSVVVEALRGAPAPRAPRGVPTAVRRVVLSLCGIALTGGAIQPALATPTPGHGGGHHVHAAVSLLDGLPYPDRAVGGPPHAPVVRRSQPARTHVVSAGDTLWSIAAADLPPDARNPAIAARWHAIYAANRTVLGPDPDLIEPGQLLHLPGRDRT